MISKTNKNRTSKKVFLPFVFFILFFELSFAQLSVYNPLPDKRFKSEEFNVRIRELNADGAALGEFKSVYTHAYLRTQGSGVNNAQILSDNHWATFSFSPDGNSFQVEIEVSLMYSNISKVEFRPTTSVSSHRIEAGKLYLTMESDKMLTIIVNNDIKKPLFLFCDPADTDIPDKKASDVFVVSGTSVQKPLRISNIPTNIKTVYFEPGIHYIYDKNDPISSNGGGLVITNNNGVRQNGNQISHVYIEGGALVVGTIRAPKVNGLKVSGRGLLVGEYEGVPYASSGGSYLSDRIYNSAVVMADYNGTTNRNQSVEGITILLPLKYCIQVGAYATVKNIKSFAFSQTTDGVGAEKGAIIKNNFFKVNDDIVKIYNDDMLVENTMIWHQNNGACFQFGWNESQGKNSVIKNTYLLHDDAALSNMNDSHWDNHSFINWHSTGYTSVKPVHQGHVFDGINTDGMPLVDVWRFIAFNLNCRYPCGSLGGILKDLTIKNVNLGPEKLDSYIGATVNNSVAEVTFENVKLNGVCLNGTNVQQEGNVSVAPATNICVSHKEAPETPVNVAADYLKYNEIGFSWEDASGRADGFIIEKSDNGIDNWVQIADQASTGYADTDLSASITYFYRIKAYNNIGSSAYNAFSFQTAAAPTEVPVAPTGLTANVLNDKKVSLIWTDNSINEDGYIVQIKEGTLWENVAEAQANSQTIIIDG